MVISNKISLSDFEQLLFAKEDLSLAEGVENEINNCFYFLQQFAAEKVIYGINTGFGPMAQWRIDDKHLMELQYNIIRSHSTGAGQPLPVLYVRAAMISRLMTFVQAHSGVHIDTVKVLLNFLNNNIYPFIPQHGSVGASGDLVQLSHIALALIGEGEVFYKGKLYNTSQIIKELGITPLQIHLREGLAITNGTAVMTGISLVNIILAKKLLSFATRASVLMNEIASSFDDFMSSILNDMKLHQGQKIIAEELRKIAAGSRRLLKRENELYRKNDTSFFNHKVQPYYSLRCIPQILGPILDEISNAEKVVVNELNSVDDNPVIDPQSNNVYHGGNFHGDYVSFEMDKLKIAVTKMTMLAERQMNYLFHDKINGILPPFVNLGVLGLNYGLQASQFTATSTTAESQTLSNPMYVHSIPNNNDNQDIVSMGTNSALICKHVIENAFQVMAIHMLALVQAVDCLKIQNELSVDTRSLYDDIRKLVPVFVEDTPKYKDIQLIESYLKNIEGFDV